MSTQPTQMIPNIRHRITRSHLASRTKQLAELLRDDRGAATAEYAVVVMAAVGFAGLLVVILRGDVVRQILTDLVERALNTAG